MTYQLTALKAAKIEWLLLNKKRLVKLSQNLKTYFNDVYPNAHKEGGISAALASLAVVEEIEAQLIALKTAIRAMVSPEEQAALTRECRARRSETRECRARRSDAYERVIERAIDRLKNEMRVEAAASKKARSERPPVRTRVAPVAGLKRAA